MLKNIKRLVVLTFLFTLLILYIKNSNLIIKEFLLYTNIFITKLFPSVFIIYIMTNLLLNYGIINQLEKIFKKNATKIYIFIISLLSGFPSGPKTIKDLLINHYITEEDANKLIKSYHFPNPIFTFSTIKTLTNNINNIYISIILSNIIIILKNKLTINKLPNIKEKSFTENLTNSINQSLKISIIIYGTSIFFYLISIILLKYLPSTKINYVLINFTFDLTKGLTSTSIINNQTLKDLIIIILLTFSPLNINIQIKSILSDTKIKYKNYIIGRINSTLLTIIIYFIIRSL